MSADVVVAGHICLDIIPNFPKEHSELHPGALVEVGNATFSPGGAVSNVGLAVQKLGLQTRLVAYAGDDRFGHILRAELTDRLSANAIDLATMDDAATSYTIVVSPPNRDRTFLHHAGCNDAVEPGDVDPNIANEARLFYFGYPPAMRGTYADGGGALADLLSAVKQSGASTALDVSMPDPYSDAGRTDWLQFMQRVLPHVDIFLPSLQETRFMLDREPFVDSEPPSAGQLARLSGRLIDMGVAVAGLKLGRHGLYVRTASEGRLQRMGRGGPADGQWAERELWAPIYQVKVQGTTGAGDSTVAGFLSALLRGTSIEETLNVAVAVGACSVEARDATSGVLNWTSTLERMQQDWPRQNGTLLGPGWIRHASGVLAGPDDRLNEIDTESEVHRS